MAIVLRAGEVWFEDKVQARKLRSSSRRRPSVPVWDPGFWRDGDVALALSRVLRFFFGRELELDFVPSSEGKYLRYRFEREDDPARASERGVHIQVFSPDVDGLSAVLREHHRDQPEQLLVSLHSTASHGDSWWDIVDSTGAARNTNRMRVVHATLGLERGDGVVLNVALPLVHLLTTIAIAVSLDRVAVSLPKSGIEHLQLPLSLSVMGTDVLPAVTPAVTEAVCSLVSKTLDKAFAITNPLLWHTPSQSAANLLEEADVASARSERALWDVLLGRTLVDPARRLDRALATLCVVSNSGLRGESERRELLRVFTRSSQQLPVRAFVQQMRELPTLPKDEIWAQLKRSPAGARHLERDWRADIRDLLLRHADEMSRALIELLHQTAEAFVAGSVSFHSFLGQALLPAELEQFRKPTFQQRGDMWVLWFEKGEAVYLKNSRGLQYIHFLLENPRQEHSAVDVRATANDNETLYSRSMPVIDHMAIRSYREYRRILLQKLSASNDNNLEERRELERELQSIDQELSRGVSITGKPRTTGVQEQARRSVSAAIHRALKLIEDAHPALRAHLDESLRIGNFLSYTPRTVIDWLTA